MSAWVKPTSFGGTTDGAAPVIVGATSTLGSTTLTVTFSEAVDTSSSGGGDLVVADFVYSDLSAGGAGSLSVMGADADGTDNVVTITVNAAFNAGDNNTDTLAAAASQIYDLADIPAGTTAVTITVSLPVLSSSSSQSFTVSDSPTVAATLTIIESLTATTIKKKNDLRIRIPMSSNMTWDTSVTTVTVGGGAFGKVAKNLLAYEDAGKTAVLDVLVSFALGDQVTIDGLTFMSFVAPSPPDNLELEVGANNIIAAEDDKTKAVVADAVARIVSDWDQLFFEGDPSTAASPIHVTDGTSASITTGNDIRIRIPAGLDMEWDLSVGSVGVSGGASGKVSSIVAYEDLNKTVVIPVTTDFAPSDHVAFSGLSFKTFIESPPGSLELEVLNDNVVTSTDPRTITIGPRNEVLVFTAKSTSTENRLEWLNPPSGPYVQTWIRARDGIDPTGPFDGRLVVGQAGGLGATDWFVDTGLTDGTTVHYAAFVDRGSGNFSAPKKTKGRPFDHVPGPVKWAYSTGLTTMAPPGIRFSGGVATVFAVSNDKVLHSMYGGAGGGDWPPAWKPYPFKEPAQARPPVVSFTIGSATNGAALIGSQDGSVYVIDADNGSEAWKSTIAGTVQAAPAG